ncbi:MAG: glycosyltransferase family 2 protein [Bacteroidota bacterium]|jgi:4,4'-diaponeurosporenoate glycosyltransferase
MDIVLIAAAAIFYFAGFVFLFRIPICSAQPGGKEPPYAISVIIPARNEAGNLPRLLSSLNAQSATIAEIIVVDDHSTDGTAAIATAHGAAVLPSQPLPAGWVGKAWACWQGAKAAQGDLFVFLDADVWLLSDGLRKIVATYAHRPGALSIAPFHVTEKPYEQLSAFFNIIMMGSINAFGLPGVADEPTGLFGPSLIVSRDHYFAVGGHAEVKQHILENFFLSREFLAKEIPIVCCGGKGALSFRMYPHGIAELYHGWSKAFATGAGNTPAISLTVIIVWLSGMIIAAVNVAAGYAVFGPDFLLAGGVVYLAYAAQLQWMLRRIGRFAWYTAMVYPVPLVFFIVVFIRSAIITSRGDVQWKNRTVPSQTGA